ncbi:MAG TPA: hypothetical protein VF159_12310 [Gemmatimonadaceae bacterium]
MRSLAFLLIVFLASAATAQSAQDVAAYNALLLTPPGALPPIATSTMTGQVQNGAQLALRYGYVSSNNSQPGLNDIGVTGVLPMGLGTTVSLTGGVVAPTSCSGCSTGLLLGLGGDTRLTEMAMGTGRDGSRLTFTLNGEIGYGHQTHSNELSGAVGVPIALVSGGASTEMHFVPYVTPGFGFGRTETDNLVGGTSSESGTRFMLGAGIHVFNPSSNVAFGLGVQHIAISGGQTQVGLSLILGGH